MVWDNRHGGGDVVELRLLGEVALFVDGRAIDLGPAKQRCVLAALAMDANRVVSADQLARRVWGENPPLRARATLINYLSRLRQALETTGAAAIVRRSGGYCLAVDQTAIDLHRFHDLCERARVRTDDDHRTMQLLEEALGSWRGEALTGLGGEWTEAERGRLRQERLTAEHDLIDARLRAGRSKELVADLSARAAQHPLDERVAGQYLLALYRAGRVADALAHYREVRQRLVDELGTDPGAALQDLHNRILAADPTLAAPHTPAAPVVMATEPVVPRQLPAAPAPFVGRHDELDRLDAALRTRSGSPAPVVMCAIAGAGGIGKTWLALHWAHRHADRFPDGQLFVDLRGFSPDSVPMEPAVAVRGFLDALGVAPGRIPIDVHARTALFRSLVAGKRMLLVLDNAIDTAQVTALLPGSETCTVVATSRHQLPGLITRHGAQHQQLDVLGETEARALLANRLGSARIEADRAAVQELIRLCGGFPLALSIVAGHAGTRPHLPLSALAAELRGLGLSALDGIDPIASMPTVLSWSHNALPADQATAFALLGIAPGPDISLPAAASLTGLPPAKIRAVLRGLEQASLINQDARGRHRMHDLIRGYAAITAHHNLTQDHREAALRRVADFYLHTAHAAAGLLRPHVPQIRLDAPLPGACLHPLADLPAALAWLDTEHRHLLAAQHTAAAQRQHQVVWHLARTVTPFHQRRGHLHDDLTLWQAALDAATHLPDPTTLTCAHRQIGRAHARLGRHDEATAHLHQALALAEHHHDTREQARTHQELAAAWEQRGDDRKALDHARDALDLHRTLGDPVWEAIALNQVGWYTARVGNYASARDYCHAALTLYRRHRHPAGEAATLDSLGYIDHNSGQHYDAVHHYRQALAVYRDFGHTYQAASTLEGLGHPYAALGEHEQSRVAWREALELFRRQGRDQDAERVQRQLDALDHTDGDQPAESAK